MQLKKYNEFSHFCYFDGTDQQQPPFTQVLTVHHYTSLELLHKNNQSNLAALYKGLKLLLLHMHISSSSLYCTIKLRCIPIKVQNDSSLNSLISPLEVERIIQNNKYIVCHHLSAPFSMCWKDKDKVFHVYTIKGYLGEEVQLHLF